MTFVFLSHNSFTSFKSIITITATLDFIALIIISVDSFTFVKASQPIIKLIELIDLLILTAIFETKDSFKVSSLQDGYLDCIMDAIATIATTVTTIKV